MRYRSRVGARPRGVRCLIMDMLFIRRSSILGLAATFLLGAGCAAVPDDPIEREIFLETNDPLEPMNRAVFAFNMQLDRLALEPIAKGYRAAVPEFGRNMVRNFFWNLKSPVILVNDLLQGEPGRAGETVARFMVNTTIGIGGLFDVAGIERHEEDLGQTLAAWGAGEGPYIVFPFHGPTNLRDLSGLVGDRFFDPFTYALDAGQAQSHFAGRTVGGAIDARSRNIEEFDDVRRSSLDLYSTFRSLYRQQREFDIRNGAPAPFEPFLFDEFGGEEDGVLRLVIPPPAPL